MVDRPKILTAEDLMNLPTGMGERYELVEGELIRMSPAGGKHGAIANKIAGYIFLYLQKNPIGVGLTAETGYRTRGDDKTVRAPDYSFIRSEKIPAEGIPEGYLTIVPDLVVEVVSPHDKADEIDQKTQEWLNFGVPLVWVVYPKTHRILVFKQGETHVFKAEDTITGEAVLPDFRIRVDEFFT